jgi:hypothetical protein
MTKAEQLAEAEERFRECAFACASALDESHHAYGIWQAADAKLVRLLVEKNNAWGALEMARATVAAERRALDGAIR